MSAGALERVQSDDLTWVSYEIVRRSGYHNMITEFGNASVDAACVLATVLDDRSLAAALVRVTLDRQTAIGLLFAMDDISLERWKSIRTMTDVLPQGSQYYEGLKRSQLMGMRLSDNQQRLFDQWRAWGVEPRKGIVLSARKFMAEQARMIVSTGELITVPARVAAEGNEYTLASIGVQLYSAGMITESTPFGALGEVSVEVQDDDDDDEQASKRRRNCARVLLYSPVIAAALTRPR